MSEQITKQEKALARYAEGVGELDAVLAGLSEAQLDLCREEGKWSIRQILHHIADAEDIWETCIKAALGNPGCTFDLNWYIPDNKAAVPLDYAHRPITVSVELFRALRRYILELVKYLPDAWDQTFTIIRQDLPQEGKLFSVGAVISFQNFHFRRHIKQIQETRQAHGI